MCIVCTYVSAIIEVGFLSKRTRVVLTGLNFISTYFLNELVSQIGQ